MAPPSTGERVYGGATRNGRRPKESSDEGHLAEHLHPVASDGKGVKLLGQGRSNTPTEAQSREGNIAGPASLTRDTEDRRVMFNHKKSAHGSTQIQFVAKRGIRDLKPMDVRRIDRNTVLTVRIRQEVRPELTTSELGSRRLVTRRDESADSQKRRRREE